MLGMLYAIITVLAWGAWLTPSQNIAFRNQQIRTFYVAAANLVLATLVFLTQGLHGLTWSVFWLPFVGGLVWSVSGFLAFYATNRLGMARAYGIWAPINVGISIFWGILIFGEFLSSQPTTLVLLALALVIIIAGVLLIIFAKGFGAGGQSRSVLLPGLLAALGAGVLWGTYYIPIKLSAASMWVAAFPLSLGIFVGSVILVALTRQPLRLDRSADYLRVTATGLMWGIGNYGMLLLVEQLGAGRGFTISQLGVVVNGLIGVYLLRDPAPRSRAALLTLIGCVLASLGGILLGGLK
ncbi:MAG TPA: GRP family sugar transporter [Anaerolineaceae bacterium]